MSNHDLPGNDYAAVAKFRLEGVHDQQSNDGMTDATMIAAALDAQSQATLALAFEQRTANLLHAYGLEFQNPTAVYDEIQTRLGLGETK